MDARDRELLELHRAYRRIAASEDGRRVMADLERRGFFSASTWSPEPARLAFNEGRRSLVLHMKNMADPANFKHLTEGKDE